MTVAIEIRAPPLVLFPSIYASNQTSFSASLLHRHLREILLCLVIRLLSGLSGPTPPAQPATLDTVTMHVKDITPQQLEVFTGLERTCSVLSLLGCVFVISTFCLSTAFHRPINRLVFYASFGNLMTNVATLMARNPLIDLNSGLCQFQAFLIQM